MESVIVKRSRLFTVVFLSGVKTKQNNNNKIIIIIITSKGYSRILAEVFYNLEKIL